MKKLLIIVLVAVFAISGLNAQTFKSPEPEPANLDFGKNNISIFLSDVVMKRISFEYEHIMGKEGNMSINLPASVSIADMEDINGDKTNWWVGIGMKMYPTGQGKIRYFIGPEVRIISAKVEYSVWHDNYSEEFDDDLIHSAFLLNNGMIYEPTENFIFSVNLGLGFIARDNKDSGFYPMATPSVRMGFRF